MAVINDVLTIHVHTEEEGIHQFVLNFRKWNRVAYPRIINTFVRAIERNTKKTISGGSRTGIHWSGLPNRSSAEGEPPKTQSGRLVASISSYTKKADSAIIAEVGSSVFYAPILETGRKSGHKLLPRPFLAPELERQLPNLKTKLKDSLSKSLGAMPV